MSNPMKELRVEKVVVNIGVGGSGEKLVKAAGLLEQLTGAKPVRTIAKKKIPAWNVRRGEAIGCKVTLRHERAEEFLRRALAAKDNKLPASCFDEQGSFSFGIKEHIDLPGMRYDPEVGIFGMDVCVSIERPGYRVKRRRIKRGEIGKEHLVTKEEAIEFIREKFGVEIS